MYEKINTEKLAKAYGSCKAVDGISLNVREGEIYGFLGLNGAGKTTTIRMLLGMIKPDSGDAYINGKKVRQADTSLAKDVGCLVEIPYSYPDLTVRENLEVVRRMRLLPDKNSVDKIMDKLRLSQYAERRAGHLSLGNAQRLGLAKALIHNPSILILDEPANGLDPAGIYEIRELLKDLAANHRVTVFISSHILGEIARFATRIGIINNGQLVQELDAGELDHLCRKVLVVDTLNNDGALNLLRSRDVECSLNKNGLIEINDKDALSGPSEFAKFFVENGLPPSRLVISEEDLESYFLRIIGVKEENHE